MLGRAFRMRILVRQYAVLEKDAVKQLSFTMILLLLLHSLQQRTMDWENITDDWVHSLSQGQVEDESLSFL